LTTALRTGRPVVVELQCSGRRKPTPLQVPRGSFHFRRCRLRVARKLLGARGVLSCRGFQRCVLW
jgi:hypothetical protein